MHCLYLPSLILPFAPCSLPDSELKPAVSSSAGASQQQAFPAGLPGKDALQVGSVNSYALPEPGEDSVLMASLLDPKAPSKTGSTLSGFKQPAASGRASELPAQSLRTSVASELDARSSWSGPGTGSFGTLPEKQAAGLGQSAGRVDQPGVTSQPSSRAQTADSIAGKATDATRFDLASSRGSADRISATDPSRSYGSKASALSDQRSTSAQEMLAQADSNTPWLDPSRNPPGRDAFQQQAAELSQATSRNASQALGGIRSSAEQSGSSAWAAPEDPVRPVGDGERQLPAAAGRSSQRISQQASLPGQQFKNSDKAFEADVDDSFQTGSRAGQPSNASGVSVQQSGSKATSRTGADALQIGTLPASLNLKAQPSDKSASSLEGSERLTNSPLSQRLGRDAASRSPGSGILNAATNQLPGSRAQYPAVDLEDREDDAIDSFSTSSSSQQPLTKRSADGILHGQQTAIKTTRASSGIGADADEASASLARSSGKSDSARNAASRQASQAGFQPAARKNSSQDLASSADRSTDASDDEIQQQMDIAFGRGTGGLTKPDEVISPAGRSGQQPAKQQRPQSTSAGTTRNYPSGSLSARELDDEDEADAFLSRMPQDPEELQSQAASQGRSKSAQPTNAQSAILDSFSSRNPVKSTASNAKLGSQASASDRSSTSTSLPASGVAGTLASAASTAKKGGPTSKAARQQMLVDPDDEEEEGDADPRSVTGSRASSTQAVRRSDAASRAGALQPSDDLEDEDDEQTEDVDIAADSSAFAVAKRASESLTPLEQRRGQPILAGKAASKGVDPSMDSGPARPLGSKQQSAAESTGIVARGTLPQLSSASAKKSTPAASLAGTSRCLPFLRNWFVQSGVQKVECSAAITMHDQDALLDMAITDPHTPDVVAGLWSHASNEKDVLEMAQLFARIITSTLGTWTAHLGLTFSDRVSDYVSNLNA